MSDLADFRMRPPPPDPKATLKRVMEAIGGEQEHVPEGYYFRDDLDGGRLIKKEREVEMTQHHDNTTRDLQAAGVPEEHHDEARALRPLALQRGIDWQELVAIVSDYGPVALAVMRRTLEAMRGNLTQPPEGKDRV